MENSSYALKIIVCFFLSVAMTIWVAGCGEKEVPPPPLTPKANPNQTGWVEPRVRGAKIALVFVHGIFGEARDTWTRGKGPSFFDLLRKNDTIKDKVDIFAFGYPSKFLASGSFDIVDAANKLTAQLEYNDINEYPTVVYVAHSMGGLVVMQQLQNQRDKMLPRVPLVMLYATPTEGAQIASLGKYVLNNPGLANMTPASQNTLLKKLNDDWVSIPAEKRPKVRCAFEKRPTKGVVIVEWTSAKGFCSDVAAAPIDEDHENIVKPTRADDDSIVVLVNALRAEVIGKQADGKLDTPDFVVADSVATFLLHDPFGKSEARLVNRGRLPLNYTIKSVSDPLSLYYWPDDSPKSIDGGSVSRLQISAPNAVVDEYKFTIQTNTATAQSDLPVVIKIPDFPDFINKRRVALEAVQQKMLKALEEATEAQQAASKNGSEDIAIQSVFEYVKSRNAALPDAGAWVMSANMLATLQLPDLAKSSLNRAEIISSNSVTSASVGQLGAIVAAQLKQGAVFTTRATPKVNDSQLTEFNNHASEILATQKTSIQALSTEFGRHESLRRFSPNFDRQIMKAPSPKDDTKMGVAIDEAKLPAANESSKFLTKPDADSKATLGSELKNSNKVMDAIKSSKVTK